MRLTRASVQTQTIIGARALILAAAWAGSIAAAAAATAPLGTMFATLPGITNDVANPGATYVRTGGGHAGLLTFELDDDYDAVQVGMLNQFTAVWGFAGLAVAPSASYGGDPAIGAAAYDLDGHPLGQMLPVQWSQGGADSAPPGNPVLSLPVAAAAAPGASALAFATTTAKPAYGAAPPGVGWSVADGLGCITPGTTVTGVSPTSVALSAPVSGPGCAIGQAVYFSPNAFGPFAQALQAAPTVGQLQVAFSDWVSVHSLPRTDGGLTTGASVAGSGVAAGTTLAGIGYTALTLSQPLAAAMPAHAPVTLTYTQAAAQDAPAQSMTVALGDATGVRPGQTVGGWPAVPAGTHVARVDGTTVTLDQATTDLTPAGTALAFTNTTWTSLPAAAGDVSLAVPSTSGRPLLHLRYFLQPGAAYPSHKPKCLRNPTLDTLPCEAPLGLPPVWVLGGGQSAGRPIDGLNFVSQLGAGAGAPRAQASYPSIFLRFVGRHAGSTLLVCGAYQVSGAYSSVSGEATAARIGAAWANAQTPGTPVPVFVVASQQVGPANNFANCNRMIDALRPGMTMIQDYSNNGGLKVADYRALVQTAAQHALQVGSQPIIYIAYEETTAQLGGVPVAADVVNATHVPLGTGIALTASGSPTLVTGPGVPPDTTATSVMGNWSLTLSQPATIAAGSILHFSHAVAANDGVRVTLSHPSFLTDAAASVSGAGIVGTPTLSVVKNQVTAQFSTPQSVGAGTLLQLSNPARTDRANGYVSAAGTFYGQTDPWDAVQLDALGAVGTDPAHPYWLCDGCNTGFFYTNDYGNSLIASRLTPLLQQLTTPPVGP